MGPLFYQGKGTPGKLEREERGTGPGRADSVSLVSLVPAGERPGLWAPAASRPRPLLPSCRCRFLWLRLSAMSSPPLMGCSCLAAPALAIPSRLQSRRPTLPHPCPSRPSLHPRAQRRGPAEHWGSVCSPTYLGAGAAR